MLKIQNEEHLKKVKEFAESKNLIFQLEEKLTYLDLWSGRNKSVCTLTPDMTDTNSFHAVMYRKDTMTGHLTLAFVGNLLFEQEVGWKLRITDY